MRVQIWQCDVCFSYFEVLFLYEALMNSSHPASCGLLAKFAPPHPCGYARADFAVRCLLFFYFEVLFLYEALMNSSHPASCGLLAKVRTAASVRLCACRFCGAMFAFLILKFCSCTRL